MANSSCGGKSTYRESRSRSTETSAALSGVSWVPDRFFKELAVLSVVAFEPVLLAVELPKELFSSRSIALLMPTGTRTTRGTGPRRPYWRFQ